MGQHKLSLLASMYGLISCTTVLGLTQPVFANYQIAQGDGDPTEISVQEQLEAAQKLADEEENIATLTAEGDFLVPNYLLKTADGSAEEALYEDEETPPVAEEPEIKISKRVSHVSSQKNYDLPIVKINQTELIPVSEQMEVEKRLTGSTKQTQQIYNKAVKRNSNYPSNNSNTDNPIRLKKNSSFSFQGQDDEINSILLGSDEETNTVSEKKKPLLLPLKGTKKVSEKQTQNDEYYPQPVLKSYSSAFADKILEAAKTNQELPLIMPMDLKVTFYPNATEFSGHTVKWLKAFSYKALQDPRYVIEVRLSKENPLLQQKRLFVIQKILANAGLSAHQLVIDYVNRPQDSLVLRMAKKEPTPSVKSSAKKNKQIINW